MGWARRFCFSVIYSMHGMQPNIATIAKKLTPVFRAEPSVLSAWVFGSRVTGRARKDSDTDVAVLLDSKLDANARFDLRLRLMGAVSKKLKTNALDLVVVNDLQAILFRYVIISEGQCIYGEKNGDRVDYECKTMSEYFDFAPFLEAYANAYVRNNTV